jgi:haloalkane dehalogenase
MRRAFVLALAVLVLPGAAHAAERSFTERSVPFAGERLHVRDYPGRGPALVLMHGFPDDLRLYDRVFGHLRGRRTIAFDFLGWGRSGRPPGHRYTFAEQAEQLEAVRAALGLEAIVPVAHDASGPAAINWALDHRDRTAGLVLLNTFYSPMPTTNAPEAIRIYSEPVFADLAAAIARTPRINHWLFEWQVGRFMSDPAVRHRFLRRLWPSFRRSLPAFASLNRDLSPAVGANGVREGELAAFDRPVRIIFGARDPYLNDGIARRFAELIPASELFLLPARHYVQVDAPRRVAALLRSLPAPA